MIVGVVIVFQIVLDNHKSTLILTIEVVYSLAVVALNTLLTMER